MTIADISSSIATRPSRAAAGHFVQFYERDETLVASLARYLRNGLESGAGAIAIATPEHIRAVEEHWKSEGFDVTWARERGQLAMLDAAGTLASISRDQSPQPDLFDEVIGHAMAESCRRFGHVVAFGEMVGLLWAQGRLADAVRLESLWNILATKRPFALLCAYRMSDCARSDATGEFREICDAHSHVTPAESFIDPADEKSRLRLVAELQQRTAALEREIQARIHAEVELSDFLENAVVGLHRVGPDGTILWANESELRMLGYARDDYVGRNIADFHADSHALDRILDRLSAGESLRDVPAKLRCKDGSVRHVLISSNALIRDGKLVHTRCFTRDVTERWLAQEALRERGAMLHLAMQGARMGYWVGDLQRGRIRGSHELATLLGL